MANQVIFNLQGQRESISGRGPPCEVTISRRAYSQLTLKRQCTGRATITW